jgi:hypothetical protein
MSEFKILYQIKVERMRPQTPSPTNVFLIDAKVVLAAAGRRRSSAPGLRGPLRTIVASPLAVDTSGRLSIAPAKRERSGGLPVKGLLPEAIDETEGLDQQSLAVHHKDCGMLSALSSTSSC